MKELGLVTIALSALLLVGCGGDSSSKDKKADIILNNLSIYSTGYISIKKYTDAKYPGNILTQVIPPNGQKAIETRICDTNIDIMVIATDNDHYVEFKNKNLPCEGTLQLTVK